MPSSIELTFQTLEGLFVHKKWKDQDNTTVSETLTYTHVDDRVVIKKHRVIRGTMQFERVYFDHQFKDISKKQFEPQDVLDQIKKEKLSKKDDKNE